MIADDLLQLITASVDGELTPTECRRLDRLLETSPEARALYAKFHADSEKLRALPRVVPPVDLHTRVTVQIAALTATCRASRRAWVGRRPASRCPREQPR